MPNGDPHWDPTPLNEWFAPIADAIEQFAARRNLQIDKYYHQSPSWSLRFSHPNGGEASIQLCKSDENRLLVAAGWWVDDEVHGARYSHDRERLSVSPNPTAVSTALEKELAALAMVEFGAWTSVYEWTEDDWENRRDEPATLPSNYPLPRLD